MKQFLLAFTLLLFPITCSAQGTPYFLVTVEGKQGFIDKSGKVVIKPYYEQVHSFVDELAPVKINGKWGFIDKLGRRFIHPQFDEIRWSFHEGLASVRAGDKWGFIDKNGKFIIEPNLEYGHYFVDARSIINVGKNTELRHGIIDKSGKLITEQLFEWSGWSFSEGLLDVKVNGKWGYVDRNGSMVIPPKYKDARGFSEGLAAVAFDDGRNKWGFIDRNGDVIIPAEFDDAFYFSEGLGTIRTNDKIGFIDKSGKIVIEPKFEHTYGFSEGLAAVRVNGKWGFINTSGRFVVKPKYDDVWSFENGLAGVAIGKWKSKNTGSFVPNTFLDAKWGYIDRSGKVIWQPTK